MRILLNECKHGWLYRISSRNLFFGVFNENTRGFVGIREKFGREYLFTEYHRDTGAPFGTVTPLQCLEECSIQDLSEYHVHIATADDSTKWIKEGSEMTKTNKPLFDWLKIKEKAYRENL